MMTASTGVVTLRSREDKSVNFVLPTDDGGYFEARFVQRSPTYFIVYLSSFSGCNKACRFCHLTATKQGMQQEATLEDFIKQAAMVFDHYAKIKDRDNPTEKVVHFNFMARGEPLSNGCIVTRSNILFDALHSIALAHGLESKFKISSIIPKDFSGDLAAIFTDPRSQLYYSLYSMDAVFRKKWLPNAMDPSDALDLIKQMQIENGNIVTLHWAFIECENASVETVENIAASIILRGIRCKFNLVRYNPYGDEYGKEPPESYVNFFYNHFVDMMTVGVPGFASKMVPRVGYDVKASCGMFVEKQ